MEEKIIVKSERYDVKKFFKIMVIIGAVFAIISSLYYISQMADHYDLLYDGSFHEHDKYCYEYEYWDEFWSDKNDNNLQEYKMDCPQVKYGNALSYAFSWFFDGGVWYLCLIPVVGCALIGGLIYLWLRSYEMVVTDKRVYGSVAWGKRVDLPLDSISSTAIGGLKGISVATSSGKIKFLMIKNAAEIFEKVNILLMERQKTKNAEAAESTTVVQSDEMDKIKKLKELLDLGVITQEEFDAKKKELLGL